MEGLGISVGNSLAKHSVAPHNGLLTRLKPSPINGVGVFAIRRIKKGTRLFAEDLDEIRWLKADALPKQQHLRQFYDDFAIVKNGRYGCPRHFHRLTISWYLNDPKKREKPNVRCDDDYEFWALRDIEQGEELTVDSTTYSDHAKAGNAKSPQKKPKK